MSVEGFFGSSEQNLVDMIQMWGLTKSTGILNIRSGKEEGDVHFEDGRMVWAKAGSFLSNEDAIYHILALEEGRFRFVNTSGIKKNGSLNASYNEIIMEGMRRLDHLKNRKKGLEDKLGFIPYVSKGASLEELSYEENVFLGLVDGRRNLEKVFNHCGLGAHKSFEVYEKLLSSGIVKLRKVRVLVVDDQGMWRKVISAMLTKEPYFDVVGTAEDGVDALNKFSELRPDVMTLDLEMPRLNGLKTLYWMMSGGYDLLLKSQYNIDIKETYRCPVVVISAVATRMAPETLEALIGGASAYITKPSQVVTESIEEQQQRIAKTVLMASQVDLVKSRRIKTRDVDNKEDVEGSPKKLVCIAASMVGGLTSLIQLIPQLPHGTDAAVYVVIDDLGSIDHAKSFAEFLDRHSQMKVLTADRNTVLRKGAVYISSGDRTVQFGTTRAGQTAFKVLQNSEEGQRHLRPIDTMLHSAIRCKGFDKRLGIVLAGDGADGKVGFLEMAKNGEKVFAQDSYSSLNPIKPEFVSSTGITRVIPLGEMARAITDEIGRVDI